MKNVMGQEIPIDTPADLVAFYERNVGPTFPDVADPKHWGSDQVAGKDKHFLKLLEDWAANQDIKTLLDVGADWGKYMWEARLALSLKHVCCMEISPTKAGHLRQVMAEHKIPGVVLEGNAESEPLPKADLVLAMDVIEHFQDWRAGWKNLLQAGQYVYALVPAGKSFAWSEDHLHTFTYDDVAEMVRLSKGLVKQDEVWYKDAVNGWYAILVRGYYHGKK